MLFMIVVLIRYILYNEFASFVCVCNLLDNYDKMEIVVIRVRMCV